MQAKYGSHHPRKLHPRRSVTLSRFRNFARKNSPAPIYFPSGLQAQAETFDLPPRSLLLTTITVFDFLLLLMSQIRRVLSADAVRKREAFLGCQARLVTAATCPLEWRPGVRQAHAREGSEKLTPCDEDRGYSCHLSQIRS